MKPLVTQRIKQRGSIILIAADDGMVKNQNSLLHGIIVSYIESPKGNFRESGLWEKKHILLSCAELEPVQKTGSHITEAIMQS